MDSDNEKIFYFTGQVEIDIDYSYEINGKKYSPEDFIQLVGAPDGSKIEVRNWNIITEHPIYEAPTEHRIFMDEENNTILYLNVEIIALHNQYQGKGFAKNMLQIQIQKAQELGFSELCLYADGSFNQPLNGYYSWPRLGFNAAIPKGLKLPNELEKCEDILDIMSNETGRIWWKQNGVPANMNFELIENSKSIQAFNKYLKEDEGK